MPKKRLVQRSNRFNPLKLREKTDLPKAAEGVRTPTKKLTLLQRLKFWDRRGKKPFKWSWRAFFIWTGGTIAVFLVAVAGLFAYYVRDLPNPRELTEAPSVESTKILDRTGKPLYTFYGEENRTLVTADQISPYVKEATVSLEDASFYSNPGFDVRGIARAAICRFWPSCGRTAGGGSTITQQYVKNALLTRAQTADRKLRELILSVEVEQIYSKEEILTGYLNEIPYGSNAYGIEAASRTYFQKSAKDLTLAEAATLASIPQRPTYYSPFGNNLEALFARKDYTLDRMVTNGYISQADADAAKLAAPNNDNPTFAKRSDLIAPQFVFYVRQQLLDFLDSDPKTAELKLDQAGYTVTTSLDLDTQNLAEGILKDMGAKAVTKYQASNAAITAVDPKTGEVLAMVGSIDYLNSKSGNTNFATAGLQPGSSFKPFVYATAFNPDHKYFPASTVFDLKTDFGGGYSPNNYNGQTSGPLTDRNALDRSLNIPAVKNLALVGIKDAIGTAKALGISTLNEDPSHYGLSLVLGSGEVQPVEMANAYAAFANEGKHFPLRPVLKIEKDGKVLKDYTQVDPTQAITKEVAYEMANVMSDNNARAPIFGTKNSLTLGPDRPVGAKSGTTQNNRDGWTVGYTPQISVAVWVGNNEPGKTMVKGADGSVVAAPIWNKFMVEYLKGKPVEQFVRPDTIKDFTVDKLSGKIPTDQSPPDQRITDIFAPWQIPTEVDDVHVKVNIDSTTGKLATALTPNENIVVKYFCKIHSEQPNNPNWEGPVQAWAASNGCSDVPPKDSDDVHTEANKPTVTVTTPANNSTVAGSFTITATPGGPRAITKVEFFINNVSVGSATSAPWSMTYDADSLPDGSSIIQAVAHNDINLTASDQVSVTKGVAVPAPGPLTGLTATPGKIATSKAISLKWKNPSETSVTTVSIVQTGPMNATYSRAVSPGADTVFFVPFASSALAGTYTFTLRARTAGGVEGPSASIATQMVP